MEFVDYKCLESLLIEGEEMIVNEATSFDSTLEKIYNKIGKSRIIPKDDKSYIYLSELIETCKYPEKLTQNDIMCLHNYYYDEQYSLDYFAPSEEPEDIAIVKKNKPVPIYNFGNGDFFCITASGTIKEYIHDSKNLFDSPYAKNFKNYKLWFEKYYMKMREISSLKRGLESIATESSNSRIDSNRIKSYIIKRIMQLVPFIINDKNASSINVKLLVSKSAYSLDFNATVNKIKYNAMKMVDDGMIKEKDFNTCAEDIAKFVRKQSSYNPSKVNKYSFSFMPDGAILNDGEITTGKSKFIDLTGGGPIDDNIQY